MHLRYFANEKQEDRSGGSSCPESGAVHLNNCFNPTKGLTCVCLYMCVCMCLRVRSCNVKLVAEQESVDRSAGKSCNPFI